MVRVELQKILRDHPEVAQGQVAAVSLLCSGSMSVGSRMPSKHTVWSGSAMQLSFPVGAKQDRRVNALRSAAAKDGDGVDILDDADKTVSSPTGGDRGTLTISIQLEPVGVLQAAQSLGVTPAAAQVGRPAVWQYVSSSLFVFAL